mmetsp:Transcript_14351/g.36604  ORF Transcript_14351/g.36604 Transcript_14351/m.36604 type:complete len:119 (-) Transcript_14351:849-1205(-)
MEALDVRNAPDYDAEVEMAKWLEMELGAKPSYSQFFSLAKDFYRVGRYDWSIYCIKQHMRDVPFERASSHLMGHCLFRQGKFEEATLELAKEVNKGFDEDWQLIIEGTIEHQRSRQEV